LVGAVVLADDAIVGEGFHAEFGGPHAEVVALAAAGDRARGATLISTVEPCNHEGKQPACTDLIVRAGIRRVVVGMPDPNPVARGGLSRLEQAGVEVEISPLRDQAERQNAIFLHTHSESPRPFVAVKLATSLDHRIADPAGHSRWISGDEARDWVHWFRAGFGAIGVGGRTALVDFEVESSPGPRRGGSSFWAAGGCRSIRRWFVPPVRSRPSPSWMGSVKRTAPRWSIEASP
jgi:diaminohydroxyphosphoribosylaminopyrimidine deaminase/5-amino-6-(5-phosphoribosylamino)uracil reductase